MIIGSVDVGRAALLPLRSKASRKQSIFEGGDGTVRARNKAPEVRLVRYSLRSLTRTVLEALDLFLTGDSGAGYKANAFSLTDDWGQTSTVRWWDSSLEYEETVGRLYNVTLTVRIEA